MFNSLLTEILQILNEIEKDKEFTLLEVSPYFKIWVQCKQFSFPDYLSMATIISNADSNHISIYEKKQQRLLDALLASQKKSAKNNGLPLLNQSFYKSYLMQLQEATKTALPLSVFPFVSANTHVDAKKYDEKCFWQMLEVFWCNPKLVHYASIITILTLINGLPAEVSSSFYFDFLEDDTHSLSVHEAITKSVYTSAFKDVYHIIRVVIQHWIHKSDYQRSRKYRNKFPFYSNETLKHDYWLIIVFLKMQKELANQKESVDFLNSNFEYFLDIWPYSPELFIGLPDRGISSSEQWKSSLNYFFEKAETQSAHSFTQNIFNAISVQFNDLSTVTEPHIVTLSCYYCLYNESISQPEDWLIAGTPYYSAYHFIDDFRLYGMLHIGEKTPIYKNILFGILSDREMWNDIIFYILFHTPDHDICIGTQAQLQANSSVQTPRKIRRYLHASYLDILLELHDLQHPDVPRPFTLRISKELMDQYVHKTPPLIEFSDFNDIFDNSAYP